MSSGTTVMPGSVDNGGTTVVPGVVEDNGPASWHRMKPQSSLLKMSLKTQTGMETYIGEDTHWVSATSGVDSTMVF